YILVLLTSCGSPSVLISRLQTQECGRLTLKGENHPTGPSEAATGRAPSTGAERYAMGHPLGGPPHRRQPDPRLRNPTTPRELPASCEREALLHRCVHCRSGTRGVPRRRGPGREGVWPREHSVRVYDVEELGDPSARTGRVGLEALVGDLEAVHGPEVGEQAGHGLGTEEAVFAVGDKEQAAVHRVEGGRE